MAGRDAAAGAARPAVMCSSALSVFSLKALTTSARFPVDAEDEERLLPRIDSKSLRASVIVSVSKFVP